MAWRLRPRGNAALLRWRRAPHAGTPTAHGARQAARRSQDPTPFMLPTPPRSRGRSRPPAQTVAIRWRDWPYHRDPAARERSDPGEGTAQDTDLSPLRPLMLGVLTSENDVPPRPGSGQARVRPAAFRAAGPRHHVPTRRRSATAVTSKDGSSRRRSPSPAPDDSRANGRPPPTGWGPPGW